MAGPSRGETVLLTGFPSFGARRMCQAILEAEPESRVVAIVRPKFVDEARVRVDELPPSQGARVEIYEGDCASMDLGLSGREMRSLATQIRRIHHCAQVSWLGSDRESAEQVNVGGTREVIEFARLCTDLQAVVFHSTAYVCGDRTGLVLEEELKAGQRFRNHVEETKARAEKLVRNAMRDLPLCVVRPGVVVGDSSTGEIDRLDGPYLIVWLILTSPPEFVLPLPGKGEAALHVVPIDYVTRAAYAIGRDPRALGKTFHLVDPAPITVRRAFELVAQAGGKPTRGFIPASFTTALLRAPGLEKLARRPRAVLEMLGTQVSFRSKNTEEILAGTSIRCPPFESYVDKLVAHVEHRLRERRAKRPAPLAAREQEA